MPCQMKSVDCLLLHESDLIKHSYADTIKGHFPLKVIFHQRLSSIEGRLPSKVVFHRRSSSIKGLLPSKVLFHQRLSSNKGLLPLKVVIHQRLFSIEGHPPLKIVFFFWVIFIFGFLCWVWHSSAQPFVICLFEFVHFNDLHYFSLWEALDKKLGFSFSSTTSLKSKVDISSRNLLHQVNYRGRWESFLPG